MMLKIRNSILLLALFVCACSSSDDDNTPNGEGEQTGTSSFLASQQPQWQVDLSGNEQRPQWTAPDPSMFENKMIVMLRLDERLVPYSTDDDLMAVFVDDECRALSMRSGDDQKVFFVLNVHGNTSGAMKIFRLCYYSGGLRQIFELTGENMFFGENIVGVDNTFSPPLLSGIKKYALTTEVTVSLPKTDDPILTDGDLVAVFVDGECRGAGSVDQTFTVFTNTAGEKGELRYYSQKRGGIFTAAQRLTLTGEPQTVTFEF